MRSLVRSALGALGIRRLLLGVHDAALPGDPSDDAGRGAPLSRGSLAFLRFAHDLGFDGIQFGPQGKTSEVDASPYDGTLFSRSTLSLALGPLHAEGILPEEAFAQALRSRPAGSERRVDHRSVFRNIDTALSAAFAASSGRLDDRRIEFARHATPWLERDSLHGALSVEHGDGDWLRWPEGDRRLYHPAQGEEDSALSRRVELFRKHAALAARNEFEQL